MIRWFSFMSLTLTIRPMFEILYTHAYCFLIRACITEHICCFLLFFEIPAFANPMGLRLCSLFFFLYFFYFFFISFYMHQLHTFGSVFFVLSIPLVYRICYVHHFHVEFCDWWWFNDVCALPLYKNIEIRENFTIVHNILSSPILQNILNRRQAINISIQC